MSDIIVLMASLTIGPFVERLCGGAICFETMSANLKNWIILFAASAAFSPMAVALPNAAITELGGGLLVLPEDGLGLCWAIPLFVLAMELADYGYHRAQHAWPFLWAMHSLHHSDPVLGITTSIRHFWADPLIRMAVVYPPVMLLMRPSLSVLAVYNALLLWGHIDHLNVRLSFGRFWAFLTSPQYHRIHHAAADGIIDSNFAATLLFIDVIFGTCHKPKVGEFPASGLREGRLPAGFLDLVFWPGRSKTAAGYGTIL